MTKTTHRPNRIPFHTVSWRRPEYKYNTSTASTLAFLALKLRVTHMFNNSNGTLAAMCLLFCLLTESVFGWDDWKKHWSPTGWKGFTHGVPKIDTYGSYSDCQPDMWHERGIPVIGCRAVIPPLSHVGTIKSPHTHLISC